MLTLLQNIILVSKHSSLLQVRHRYVQCVTATCFYIAAKLEEDPEVCIKLKIWLDFISHTLYYYRSV